MPGVGGEALGRSGGASVGDGVAVGALVEEEGNEGGIKEDRGQGVGESVVEFEVLWG